MALTLGELSIALDLDRGAFAAGLAATKRELQGLPNTVQREVRRVSKVMDDEGRRSGGVLAQGVRQGFVRKSPLIVAGISAALAAGAPAFIAAAGTAFAGIGIVAAAQSNEVRSAWLGTWQEIAKGTQAAAGPVQEVLVRMAGRVGQAFEELQPRLVGAFRDAAPLIESFTESLIQAGENALPGLLRAVYRAGPVFDGLGHMLEAIGTGLSDFFDAISKHNQAAGQAFAALGDIIAQLLPTLGELLGQGAELAADVLPLLASALGAVRKVVEALGPLLPALVAGFAGMKIASGLVGVIGGVAARLGEVAASGGAFAGVAGRMATGLSGISRAAGPAGVAIGFVATSMLLWVEAGQKAADMHVVLGRAFLVGGEQAKAAGSFFDEFNRQTGGLFENLPDWIKGLGLFGTTVGDLIPSAENAKRAYKDYFSTLSEGDQLTEKVALAQAALQQAVKNHGPASDEAAEASRRYADAQGEARRAAEAEERAIRGVTQAMVDQVDHTRALVDKEFAYQDALDQVGDLTRDYAAAVREHGAASEEAGDALRQLEEGYRAAGQAASDLAVSKLPASMDDQQKAIIGAREELGYYRGLLAQNIDLPPALDQHVAYLEQVVAGADAAMLSQEQLATAVEDLGFAVTRVPDSKSVDIDVPATDPLVKKLKDLGFTIETLPDGTVRVTPETAEAEGALLGLDQSLTGLGKKEATPKVGVDDHEFQIGIEAADGELNKFDKKRARPYADLNISPFIGAHASASAKIVSLDRQRPTPVAGLNTGPLEGNQKAALKALLILHGQRPSPIASLIDHASGVAASIIGKIAAIQSKTVTITTVHIDKYAIKAALATGGPVIGPGTGTSDSIPANLSNGEHVLTAREVRAAGGHGAVMAFRRGLLANPVGHAVGGPAGAPQGPGPLDGGRTTRILVEAHTSDERRIARAISNRIHDDEWLAGVR